MNSMYIVANWKMNGDQIFNSHLITTIEKNSVINDASHMIICPSMPYLQQINTQKPSYMILGAQNISQYDNGAYTGEISAPMYSSVGVNHIVIGHSERREYFAESDALLAEKVNAVLANNSTPIFCCGEPLAIREAETQNAFVENQLINSLFHLSSEQLLKVVIAYEPIWAIGTGKTASSAQAQEIHAFIRSVLAIKYGADIADQISILYGGSVKAANAVELFSQPDVDGGLVGGASLIATEFTAIINALQ